MYIYIYIYTYRRCRNSASHVSAQILGRTVLHQEAAPCPFLSVPHGMPCRTTARPDCMTLPGGPGGFHPSVI